MLHLFRPDKASQEPLKTEDELAQLVFHIGQIRLSASGELVVETDPNFPPPPAFEPVLAHLQQELRKRYFLDTQGTPHVITKEFLENSPEGSAQRRLLVEHVDDATRNTVWAVPVTRAEQERIAALMRLTEELFSRICTLQ